jgi:hypothetical protein
MGSAVRYISFPVSSKILCIGMWCLGRIACMKGTLWGTKLRGEGNIQMNIKKLETGK